MRFIRAFDIKRNMFDERLTLVAGFWLFSFVVWHLLESKCLMVNVKYIFFITLLKQFLLVARITQMLVCLRGNYPTAMSAIDVAYLQQIWLINFFNRF